jgi:NADH:ubiquinone oxidoreductase subunit E
MADSDDILQKLRHHLNVDIGATTVDEVFTLETTECLGQCDSAPGMSIDEQYYGNLTGGEIKRIINSYRTIR